MHRLQSTLRMFDVIAQKESCYNFINLMWFILFPELDDCETNDKHHPEEFL